MRSTSPLMTASRIIEPARAGTPPGVVGLVLFVLGCCRDAVLFLVAAQVQGMTVVSIVVAWSMWSLLL